MTDFILPNNCLELFHQIKGYTRSSELCYAWCSVLSSSLRALHHHCKSWCMQSNNLECSRSDETGIIGGRNDVIDSMQGSQTYHQKLLKKAISLTLLGDLNKTEGLNSYLIKNMLFHTIGQKGLIKNAMSIDYKCKIDKKFNILMELMENVRCSRNAINWQQILGKWVLMHNLLRKQKSNRQTLSLFKNIFMVLTLICQSMPMDKLTFLEHTV